MITCLFVRSLSLIRELKIGRVSKPRNIMYAYAGVVYQIRSHAQSSFITRIGKTARSLVHSIWWLKDPDSQVVSVLVACLNESDICSPHIGFVL